MPNQTKRIRHCCLALTIYERKYLISIYQIIEIQFIDLHNLMQNMRFIVSCLMARLKPKSTNNLPCLIRETTEPIYRLMFIIRSYKYDDNISYISHADIVITLFTGNSNSNNAIALDVCRISVYIE